LSVSSRFRLPTTNRESSARGGWLHLCNGLDPVRDGGMVPSILGMTGALARQGGAVSILTPTPSRLAGVNIPDRIRISGPDADLESAVRKAEVVHLHGLWQGHTRRGAQTARRANVPYLIAAHGMAEPWALRHKAIKKKVYATFVEGKNLRRAACLHALSRPEIGHLRAFAPRTPVCLVPNGVDLRPFDDLPSRSELEAEFPELVGKFIVLFFGRLHVKKGLDLLAKALGTIGGDRRDLHVLLAGKDDGALQPFLARVEPGRATYVGHASGERARRIWGAADAFVLPSYSEGFSMAILEALAARKPVLATTSCHFPELAQAGGGIVVEPTEAGVTSGLRDLLERSDLERRALAERGRALVESEYTWNRQMERLASVYRWLVAGGPAPAAVEMAGGI
jgi:glycosyltransferase involved in cell wall biosynthesis